MINRMIERARKKIALYIWAQNVKKCRIVNKPENHEPGAPNAGLAPNKLVPPVAGAAAPKLKVDAAGAVVVVAGAPNREPQITHKNQIGCEDLLQKSSIVVT